MRFTLLVTLAALLGALIFSPVRSSAASEDIVDIGAIDRVSGWLSTADRLYLTRDRGASWQVVTPDPASGERVLAADFLPNGAGWVIVGRPAENDRATLRLARTLDWGATWRIRDLSLFEADVPDPTIGRMTLDFSSATDGILRVRHLSSSNFERWSAWRTVDGGTGWLLEDAAMDAPAEDARFADALSGWRLDRTGDCSGSGATRVCRQTVTLSETSDGGQTWRSVPLPAAIVSEREYSVAQTAASAAAMSSRTMVAGGQGFDKCEVATLGEFSTWRANSPYSASNLYIGGSKRACGNRALNADYIRSIASMGWTFIPTWVGPQSPCYGGNKGGISRDPAVAQSQGWAEGHAAADTAARLGLTEGDGTGSIVYYDMEYYNTSDAGCNTAVQAFVTGWVSALHGRGNLAGVYGTGSTLRLLANLSPAPDAIWAAHWIYDEYNPGASVWNVYSLSNDLWVSGQRLRQYTGGHNETWGGATLNIDANALEGIVAVIAPPAPPTLTPTPTATRVPITPVAWQYLPMTLR